MGEHKKGDISTLLTAWQNGDADARDTLFNRLYSELRQISAALLRAERSTSLSTGDLVNEAVLRLMQLENIEWANKSHFLALAAKAMRRSLIDHARKRNSDKRRHEKITLITKLAGGDPERIELDTLEKAMIRLSIIEPDLVDIVELRYFGGMTLEDIAEVKGTSVSTIKRSWRVARAWLLDALKNKVSDDRANL